MDTGVEKRGLWDVEDTARPVAGNWYYCQRHERHVLGMWNHGSTQVPFLNLNIIQERSLKNAPNHLKQCIIYYSSGIAYREHGLLILKLIPNYALSWHSLLDEIWLGTVSITLATRDRSTHREKQIQRIPGGVTDSSCGIHWTARRSEAIQTCLQPCACGHSQFQACRD